MKTALQMVNDVINENIFHIKSIYVMFGDKQFMSKHTFHKQHPSICLFHLDLLYLLIC